MFYRFPQTLSPFSAICENLRTTVGQPPCPRRGGREGAREWQGSGSAVLGHTPATPANQSPALPVEASHPSPLVYQTMASLGLTQVQPRSPKVVVATGAAARALKNSITFLPKIKSSLIKYEYIRPLSHRLRVQSNLVSSRWMFERARTSICACYGD